MKFCIKSISYKIVITIAATASLLLNGTVFAQNSYDVALSGIECPNGQYMSDEALQYPYVIVENIGQETINSIDVYYRIDEGDAVLRHVAPIILNQGETRNVIFPQITLPDGMHTFTAWVELDEGLSDENTENNTLSCSFIVAGGDIAILNIISPNNDICGLDSIYPTVNIKNVGAIDVESFVVDFSMNEVIVQSITWTGSLTPNAIAQVVFDGVFPTNGEYYIEFLAHSPNESVDANMVDNSAQTTLEMSAGNLIEVTIQTDQWGMQNSFEIINAVGDAVLFDGPLATNSLLQYSICLPPGNYVFIIYDSNGNGMCIGPQSGYYIVENATTGEQIASDCDFQDQAEYPFTIIQPNSPPVASFNYDQLFNCSGYIQFTNTTVSDVPVLSYFWNFGDGSTSGEESPIHVYAESGNYTVSLTSTNQFGSNTFSCSNCVPVNVNDGPEVFDGYSCGPGNVSLSVQSSEGQVKWYHSQAELEAFHTGEAYLAEGLNETTVYYVEQITGNEHEYFGMFDNTGPGGYFGWNIDRRLYFDAIDDVTIVSAKVYAQGTANRTFRLYDSNDELLDQKTVNIPAGESRIDLGFELPEGSGYAISVSMQNNLAYTGDYDGPSYPYPYVINGLISLTGNNYSDSFYYFLYDIEVYAGFEDQCFSGRVPVTAYIQYPNPELPSVWLCCQGNECEISAAAGFETYHWSNGSYNQSVIVTQETSYSVTVTDEFGCPGSASTLMQFNEPGTIDVESHVSSGPGVADGWAVVTVTGGTAPFQYVWSNGQTTPTATGLMQGTYSVTVIDAAGCELVAEAVIIVGSSNLFVSDNISVYPNPCHNRIVVNTGNFNAKEFCIFDISGKLMILSDAPDQSFEIELNGLPSGLYIIRLKSHDNRYSKVTFIKD
ncbi:MAG TPA: PKD domain-containing protein [Bacteroidales bacterium]|nr:PKD domain-containing protein [Bacteroidales bacterium]